jgi:hypothetical protein
MCSVQLQSSIPMPRARSSSKNNSTTPGSACASCAEIGALADPSNSTTRHLAVMNLAARGIEADFGPEHADTFRRDLHPDLRNCECRSANFELN